MSGDITTYEHGMRFVLRAAVMGALSELGIEESAQLRASVEKPAEAKYGDWSTNAAMANAKAADMAPMELADEICKRIWDTGVAHLERTETVAPGFVNFYLKPSWLHESLRRVLDDGECDYGRNGSGQGRIVSLEFVSANPTGPLHAGGGRWGAYGDSLARILERCGWDVVREYYVNDRGSQIRKFGESLLAHVNGTEVPDDGYKGSYVAQWAEELSQECCGCDLDGAEAGRWGADRALRDVRESLEELGVRFDRFDSEEEIALSGQVDEVLARLRASGAVYDSDGAVWLATSNLGDDKDRALVRSSGEATYFLPDIAYHAAKAARADVVIDVLGADHHGYVPRIRAAMELLGCGEKHEAIVGQNVTLSKDGESIAMGKRSGEMVTVRDLIDEVGADVARFVYLLRSVDSHYDIDLDILKTEAVDNPVYYVQYAHARISSLWAKAETRGVLPDSFNEVDLSVLTGDQELSVIRVLEALPFVISVAAAERAPHKVASWVRELATEFHRFYHFFPVIREDVSADVRAARLALVEGVRIGLKVGLDLLGVRAPESM